MTVVRATPDLHRVVYGTREGLVVLLDSDLTVLDRIDCTDMVTNLSISSDAKILLIKTFEHVLVFDLQQKYTLLKEQILINDFSTNQDRVVFATKDKGI